MGVTVEQWRAKIGSFSQPFKTKSRLETLKWKSVSLALRLVLFFLLVAEGIEANPGPGSRGRGGNGGRGNRGAHVVSDHPVGADREIISKIWIICLNRLRVDVHNGYNNVLCGDNNQ